MAYDHVSGLLNLFKLQVGELRYKTFAKHFPKETAFRNLLLDNSVHSECEIDLAGQPYRKTKAWRNRDLNILLAELDELYIQEQLDDRSRTSAIKTLRRGPHIPAPRPRVPPENPKDAKNLDRPPQGFPKSLVDEGYLQDDLSIAEELILKLSGKTFDVPGMIAHARRLQGSA